MGLNALTVTNKDDRNNKETKPDNFYLSTVKQYDVTVRGMKYTVILHPDPEDGGYWIECPELPGAASQGDSVDEALEMIKDSIEGHLQVLDNSL